MAPVREALNRFLRAHEPYPAVVVDRRYNLISGNDALSLLTEGVAPELLEPPANALRVTLHPGGWRRGSSTWRSGAAICCTGWPGRRR